MGKRNAPKTGPAAAAYFSPAAPPVPEIRELVYAGTSMVRRAVPLPAHRHPTLELCYIESGMAQWWVERERVNVRGGQVIVIRPHERHGGIGAVHQPCRYFFIGLHINLRVTRKFLGLPNGEGRALAARLGALRTRSFAGPPELVRHWQSLLGVTALAGQPGARPADAVSMGTPVERRSALDVLRARAALLEILLAVVRAEGQGAAPERSVIVQEALKLMEAHLEAPLSLGEFSHRLGWSISHFKARFRKEMGVAPADYYLRRRIEKACEAIAASERTLTDIGIGLGFSSSQYFATAFKRVTGLSPRAYRVRSRSGEAR
jgi:AraC-like DNA-binding protein